MTDQDETPAAEAADEADVWAEIDAEEAGAATDAAPEAEGFDDEAEDEDSEQPQEADEAEGGEDSDPPDPWAEAPEPLRAARDQMQEKLDKLEHRIRSDEGRMAAFQRQINELRSKPVEKADEPPAPDETLKTLMEDYPEIAGPIAKLMERQGTELAEIKNRLGDVGSSVERVTANRYVAQERALTEAHSDWREVLSGDNEPVYLAWLARQPTEIREAADMNAANIEDAAAAAKVVGGFKQFLANLDSPSGQPDSKNKASDRRARQLEGATMIKSGGSQTTVRGVPEEGNPEDLWAAIDRMEAHERR